MKDQTPWIVALSIVALGGIAGMVLQNRANQQTADLIARSATAGGDSYGKILRIEGDPANPPQVWKDIKAILDDKPMYTAEERRSRLYLIRQFNKDGTVSDLGELKEERLLFDVSQIKLPDQFTGFAFQVGLGGKDSFDSYSNIKGSKPLPNMPQGRSKTDMRESMEMVEQINQILPP